MIDKKIFTHDFPVKSLSAILKGFMSNTIINNLNGKNTGIHGLEKTRYIFNFSREILIQKILFGDKD